MTRSTVPSVAIVVDAVLAVVNAIVGAWNDSWFNWFVAGFCCAGAVLLIHLRACIEKRESTR